MTQASGPQILIHEGSSARMDLVQDAEADLVVTGPPYFTVRTEERLKEPLAKQLDYETVSREIVEFALTLRPVFQEIVRILKPGRMAVVQTKHIRYGRFLIPLTDIHADLALGSGLRMVSRIEWLAPAPKPERRPAFLRLPFRRRFQTYDTETFLIFSKGDPLTTEEPVGPLDVPAEELVLPLWRTSPARGERHRHGSPPKVIERCIKLYSAPGDLVVDPFCGFGTTLRVAVRLGRRAVGYDIDHECVRRAEAVLVT